MGPALNRMAWFSSYSIVFLLNLIFNCKMKIYIRFHWSRSKFYRTIVYCRVAMHLSQLTRILNGNFYSGWKRPLCSRAYCQWWTITFIFLCSAVLFFAVIKMKKINVPTEFDRFVYSFVRNKSQLLRLFTQKPEAKKRVLDGWMNFFAQLLYYLLFDIEIWYCEWGKKIWRTIKHAGIFVVIAQQPSILI